MLVLLSLRLLLLLSLLLLLLLLLLSLLLLLLVVLLLLLLLVLEKVTAWAGSSRVGHKLSTQPKCLLLEGRCDLIGSCAACEGATGKLAQLRRQVCCSTASSTITAAVIQVKSVVAHGDCMSCC